MPRYQSWHRTWSHKGRRGGAHQNLPVVHGRSSRPSTPKRSTKCQRLALPRRRRRRSNCVATRKHILRPSPSRNFQTAYLLREKRYAIGTSHATSRQSSSRCCCCRCWSSLQSECPNRMRRRSCRNRRHPPSGPQRLSCHHRKRRRRRQQSFRRLLRLRQSLHLHSLLLRPLRCHHRRRRRHHPTLHHRHRQSRRRRRLTLSHGSTRAARIAGGMATARRRWTNRMATRSLA